MQNCDVAKMCKCLSFQLLLFVFTAFIYALLLHIFNKIIVIIIANQILIA